jgi:murein L,D-transpeptidase YafK
MSTKRQAVAAKALIGTAMICALLLAMASCGDHAAPSSSSTPAEQPTADLKIVITKSERRLDLCSRGGIVHTYRVGLGGDALGDKQREGDGRTPEGEFYVCAKNPESKFYRSLGLSYPNREDAERGLRDGLISDDESDRIVSAFDKGKTPPQDTPLGGEIYIHGGGSQSDWTAGCIALDDADMRELYDAVDIGTPVTIRP